MSRNGSPKTPQYCVVPGGLHEATQFLHCPGVLFQRESLGYSTEREDPTTMGAKKKYLSGRGQGCALPPSVQPADSPQRLEES